jgi:uncharacterized protein
VDRFELTKLIAPFTRCLECNSSLERVHKASIENQLPEETKSTYNIFYQCPTCRKIYWKGSHHARMNTIIASLI